MGKCLFNLAIRWIVPYTGTIHPRILELTPGKAKVQMKDRRKVRNHLQSIHAVALMNLGEACSGLAVMSAIPDSARAILTHLEIDFLKKARGTLTANASFLENISQLTQSKKFEVEAFIENHSHELVAKVKAHWLVGPKKAK